MKVRSLLQYDPFDVLLSNIKIAIDWNAHSYSIVTIDQTNILNRHTAIPTTIVAQDLIVKIQQVFGVNISQLADILRISRATIFNHLEGGEPESYDKYLQLYELAKSVELIRPTFKSHLKNVLVNNKTLLKHLKSNWQDKEHILNVCSAIDKKVNTQPNYKAEKEDQTIATRRISKSA